MPAMKDLLILLIHLLTTMARLIGPGGVKAGPESGGICVKLGYCESRGQIT